LFIFYPPTDIKA